jgi:hypothetical protein
MRRGEPMRARGPLSGSASLATELASEKDDIGRLPSQRAIERFRVSPHVGDHDTATSSSKFRLNALDEALSDPSTSSSFGDDELAEVCPKPEVMGTGKADDPGVVFPDERQAPSRVDTLVDGRVRPMTLPEPGLRLHQPANGWNVFGSRFSNCAFHLVHCPANAQDHPRPKAVG